MPPNAPARRIATVRPRRSSSCTAAPALAPVTWTCSTLPRPTIFAPAAAGTAAIAIGTSRETARARFMRAPSHAGARPAPLGQRRLVVVQLEDPDLVGRGRVDAQAAEHALVDVARDDLHAAAVVAEDVDGADLGQLGGDGRVGGDRVVDLDADERSVDPHALTLLSASFRFMISGISEIS